MEEPTGTNLSITENKAVKQDNRMVFVLSAAFLAIILALAALVIAFSGGKSSSKQENAVAPGNLSFAWVNTDTIWEKYNFVTDVKAELATYEKNLQDQYAASVSAFQKEYDAYIKKASAYQLSLEEQKKTEEKLAQKQQGLQELDAKLSQQLMDAKTARNMEVHDSIVNFIARFNKDKKYNFILERSYGGGLLYADSTMDITNEIIKGLNKEYLTFKKEQPAQPEEKKD